MVSNSPKPGSDSNSKRIQRIRMGPFTISFRENEAAGFALHAIELSYKGQQRFNLLAVENPPLPQTLQEAFGNLKDILTALGEHLSKQDEINDMRAWLETLGSILLGVSWCAAECHEYWLDTKPPKGDEPDEKNKSDSD